MEETLPRFRYLHEKSHYWYEPDPTACIVCAEKRPGYVFIHLNSEPYGTHTLCEPCLMSGRLAEKEMCVNDVDSETLGEQIAALHPELSAEEQEALFVSRTTELMYRTPHPNLINLFVWQVCCDDYLTYFYQVNADALNALAPDGDGKAFLKSHFLGEEEETEDTFFDEAWEDKLEGFHSFYLWQCSCCSEYYLTCAID
jgi:uncharacterized protein CbrC (UPF0167 family)